MNENELTFKIAGVSPLLMHNGSLADPMNPIARQMKQISSKKSKTDADLEELARLEWHGSLYLHNGKPCIPGFVMESSMVEAAKKTRRGKQALAGLYCPENALIEHDGPQEIEELWNVPDYRLVVGVRIQRNKVMRTRPKFDKWAASVTIHFDSALMNAREIKEIMITCGRYIGLMDWRPKFGRFEVE